MRFWVLPRGPMISPMKLVPGYSFCGIQIFFHFLAGLQENSLFNLALIQALSGARVFFVR